VGALSAVALAGSGTYTFSAFALSACNFWIHIGASLRALLRRGARFVVTPKHGSRARQPRAIAPALGAVAVLVAAAAYGLARGRSPATLNNVAFAGLHSTILLIGAMPALRIGRSGVLHPEPRVIATPAHRRWPRAVSAIVAASAIGAAAGLSLTGLRALSIPASLNQQAYSAARSFMRTYVSPAGRVVRRDQGGGTVSEGQAYGLLLAVALDDRSELQRIWSWTRSHLLLSDHLLASAWSGGRVTSNRPATDADLDSAWALVLASERFGVASYRSQGVALAHAILAEETAASPFGPVLVAGPWGRAQPAIVNPSYFSPRAFADLSRAAPDPRWAELESSSRAILSSLIGRHGAPAARAGQPTAGAGRSAAASLAPDWAATDAAGQQAAWPISNPGSPAAGGGSSSFDALRIAIRFASSCDAADRRLAASLWPLYARDPGRDSYTLGGAPTSAFHHAASFVAAAAAARAAGKKAQADRLLGDAAAANEAQPTYYGAAWLALGRVMLTSAALGGCA
jgi:endoglucanase